MTRIGILLMVAALGCGGGSKGNDGGGGSSGGGGGEGGTTGGGGQGGITESCFSQGMACSNTGVHCCTPLVCAGTCVQPPGNSCPGSAGFGCLYGGCRGDVGTAPICMDGAWGCPSGATDTRSCGGCTGNPPPDYVCGDGGWILLDAGVGGATGGAGGVGGGGGAGDAGGACGKFGQPCCANMTCTQGACYIGGPQGSTCSA